jgi:signal transduction histidine kinase
VILEIRDFGKGMPAERLRLLHGPTSESGVGLAGMRERMHELNGTLKIESNACGTTMRATVPLYAIQHSLSLEGHGDVCATACTGVSNQVPVRNVC